MSDDIENTVVETDTNKPNEAPIESNNSALYEPLAKEYGWDPNGKKSAEEYIKFALDRFPQRGEVLTQQKRKLEHKDNELHKMRVVVDQLANDFKKSKETAYKQALADLQAQKREAISQGDVATVDKIEAAEKNLTVDQQIAEAQQNFHARNQWLQGESVEELAMQGYARKKDNELMALGLSPSEHLKRVEESVRERFSDYFNEDTEDNSPPTRKNNVVEGVQHEDNVVSHKKEKKWTGFAIVIIARVE